MELDTAAGRLRGRTENGVTAFLGIPYAAPPVGAARFTAPGPVPRWSGVRDAVTPGPTVPQAKYQPPMDALIDNPEIPGDDCLNLNVWTPGGTGLPVMVWLHGGAFRNGSNAVPIYDGTAFARDGVVLVSINYRLGVTGFARLPDAPANRGLLDQIAALEWVRDNIAAFGGDPARVTVFGESAGAISIATLLAMPAARGLFRRAIVQSGSGGMAADPADAAKVTQILADRLGVAPTATALSSVDTVALIEAQSAISTEMTQNPDPGRWGPTVVGRGMGIAAFLPVIDGASLPSLPVEAMEAGTSADVDLMVGTNSEEFRLFVVPNGVAAAITPEVLPMLAARMGWKESVVDTYLVARPSMPAGDVAAAILTDMVFWAPAMRMLRASRTRTYAYEFTWRSEVPGLGACHAMEIPFVFDTLAVPSFRPLSGTDSPPQALADRMHAAWVAFARDGDPGWMPYTLETPAVMTFGHPGSAEVLDPRPTERALWE
ncbi:para-nitrobenzyl esterase [Amycolatopsis xylanica]|uniref:Carboxylic ester hydrolase n=1 Tax=Amycolatopsis xylanica TaxID=589385 RepID=A0A1H2WAC7_9PSEU|nr:carboxylesterase/lipase family protein [Amycolatopsis xylanica]SDW77436.1 para-nitrobenzyl esterase [Amycolatopsis xylanica]